MKRHQHERVRVRFSLSFRFGLLSENHSNMMSSYTLIKGEFHIHYPDNPRNGPEPDGDTLKFLPDNRSLIENLHPAGRSPRFNAAGMTNIRFEGIDALETHFEEFHQHKDLAVLARDILLEQAGFGTVEFFEDLPFKVKFVEHHPIRGYLLANALDFHGRTIAFVFTGENPIIDGTHILVEPQMLEESLNVKMLELGHAYPAFYLSLPASLREYLGRKVVQTRAAGTGLWPEDETMNATITGSDQLQELVIWPKLFRRLALFYRDGHTDLDELGVWLRADPHNRDDRLLLPNRQLVNMHNLIQVDGARARLSHLSEDIVIVPDDYVLPEPIGPTRVGSIRIIAALIDPSDRPEGGNETVTILNTANQDLNLEGWYIADNSGRQELGGILARGETRRVALGSSVQLSNRRDTITILDSSDSSNPDKMIDQVSYEAEELPPEGYTKVF